MKSKIKDCLRLAIGYPASWLSRKLLNCIEQSQHRELCKRLRGCGTDVAVAFPWDIREVENVSIGTDTYIGPGVLMSAFPDARIEIGSKVMFGPRVRVIANDHLIGAPGIPIKDAGYVSVGHIRIEDDVWVGAGATILKGVSIGRGAVIGAGAVVTKSVGAYEIWVGNPARKIRSRLDSSESASSDAFVSSSPK